MHRRTARLAFACAVIVAGFIAVIAREDRPAAVYLIAYGTVAMALVSLGLFGRGRALLVFVAVYGLGSALWQWLWWTDDPELTGIDDISPIGGFVITLPWALALMAAGWVAGAIARRRSALIARWRSPAG